MSGSTRSATSPAIGQVEPPAAHQSTPRCHTNPPPPCGVLVSFDFSNAFPTLTHSFITTVVRLIEFPENTISFILSTLQAPFHFCVGRGGGAGGVISPSRGHRARRPIFTGLVFFVSLESAFRTAHLGVLLLGVAYLWWIANLSPHFHTFPCRVRGPKRCQTSSCDSAEHWWWHPWPHQQYTRTQ